MIVKALEIRDKWTFIPVIAVKMVPGGPSSDPTASVNEHYLLARAGYTVTNPRIILCRMGASGVDRNATYDPYAWSNDARTMCVAHLYIEENFDKLKSGDVIDVEFILGETTQPKQSERFS